ncbi:MAG TPA: class I SAM-dependent methyltransferase [Bacillota bacterium]|nr:class I SAM-dependent methyltransferase [Bacillota bacterium]HPF42754.1 class I SAM-dependent methyltransferase [Bacillota bacterium]HPJ85970.1 class I SAM-dependent methyltransferase [Bacillota bacterium]HPQ62009.1 class I SAM-dependent methyltransferase [Bacillota bacterium]
MTQLSPRLGAVLSFCHGFDCLIDIGSDHAYLPIEAVRQGYVAKAIAVDNKPSPLSVALKNIEQSGLKDKIETVLSDGFTSLNHSGDLVTISGIGGKLTAEILEQGDLEKVKMLVLSPNSEAFVVRDWLEKNHFVITGETFLLDRGKHYQVIAAKKGVMELDLIEKEFGPMIIREKNPAFVAYIRKIIAKLDKAAAGANDIQEKERIRERIGLLKGLVL